jgi:hypothetical protein
LYEHAISATDILSHVSIYIYSVIRRHLIDSVADKNAPCVAILRARDLDSFNGLISTKT